MSGVLGPRFLVLLAGFLAIGVLATVLFVAAGRESAPRARRRVYGILWVLLLLVGGPLWLIAAAGLGLL